MITKKVINIISTQFNINEKDIEMDTSFKDDLNADSLDLVELVMALEDEFGLEVEDEDLDHIKTVGDVIESIKKMVDAD